ncbi:MAG: serine/threonine-protein phosphatase [Clostridia bacterium]|nr:serine/threonine-protein phosphatase [Clostridia bacterium]
MLHRENQDRIYLSLQEDKRVVQSAEGSVLARRIVLAVFDGLGGEQCGEKAAELAARTLEANETMTLTALCRTMNDAICRHMQENGIRSMGAAAAIVRIENGSITACNLGDSRIYLIRAQKMLQLSVDHVFFMGGRSRPVLTQYLGIPEQEMLLEPTLRETALRSGDKLLVCSDGLPEVVDDAGILRILNDTPMKDAARVLYRAARESGGKDDISVIVCEVISGNGEQ